MPPVRGPHVTRNRADPLDNRKLPQYGQIVKAKEIGWKYRHTYRSPTPEFAYEPPSEIIRPVDPRPPKLKLKDLECLKSLGSGATGEVLLVRTPRVKHKYDKPGTLFALKYMSKKSARNAERTDNKMKDGERSILNDLPWNPFVAGAVDAFSDKMNLYLLLEVIPCGTLRSLIQKQGPFSATSAAFYFANIVAGLTFLHRNELLHRDLKPENILVGADGYLVIADFGTTAREDADTDWVMVGSPAYMAPELVSNDKQSEFSFSGIDWWSAGIILFELSTRKLPFHGTEQQVHAAAASGVIPWRKEIKMGKQLKDLISRLLTIDACKRLGYVSWEHVQNHPWLNQVSWSSIEERKYLAPYVPKEPHLEDIWHSNPLPKQRKIPGLKIVPPPPYLAHNDCFPLKVEKVELQAQAQPPADDCIVASPHSLEC